MVILVYNYIYLIYFLKSKPDKWKKSFHDDESDSFDNFHCEMNL